MRKICRLLLLVLPLFTQCRNSGPDFSTYGLKCNNLVEPAGTGPAPVLSWINSSEIRGASQKAFQIVIGSNRKDLLSEDKCLLNSGKAVSDETCFRVEEGRLEPGVKYFWKVRTWSEDESVSDWSEPASFITGLFSADDWGGARWIGSEEIPDSLLLVPGIHGSGNNLPGELAKKRTVVPYFRKEFRADKKVKQALAFVSGLGHYELYVNGEKTGDRFLAPGWTDYDKTCLFNTYDITGAIKKGNNAIGIISGNGFYNVNRERYRKLVIAYGAPKVLLKVKLLYSDGTESEYVSDESWKTAPSPVTYTSIYGGEDYDARLEQEGWSEKGFNDNGWKPVLIVKSPSGTLRPETDHPVRVMQEFNAVSVSDVNDTTWLYDFGQNCSGIIDLDISGKEGSEVRLYPGELITADSLVNQRASGGPYLFSYTTKGAGVERWSPRFTYYGFRYVQVNGAVPKGMANPGDLPVINELKLLHTRNSSPEVGSFSCSSDHFNRIYSLINWGIRSNLASVATDCPHREKLGWLEQTHLMGNSIKYVYDIHNLYSKIIDDMIEAQLPSGLVPDIAPEYVEFVAGFRDSPEWGSACVILPWDLYEWYGDIDAVKKAYPMMKGYVDYLASMAEDGILSHGLGDWYDLGPRFPGEAQLTPKSVTATAILYYDAFLLSKMAALLGQEEDAAKYSTMAEDIRIRFNNKFFNTETKVYSTGSQTAFSMPLFFGMAEDSVREAIIENLVSSVKANSNALTAGDVGYRYLLRALEESGNSQLIFDMNSKTDVPGYGYQLSKGATALTESWAGLTEVSNNHMMLGHLMEWFYSGLAGIRQAKGSQAYRHVLVSPEPVGDISWVQASYKTKYGPVEVRWNIDNGMFEMELKVPPGCIATVLLPTGDASSVKESHKEIDPAMIPSAGIIGGRAGFSIKSGKYLFTCEMK